MILSTTEFIPDREIEKILGYLSKTEIIHKDDMVLL